nr:hypothetical protein [Tanacetum cinerariifolium]
ISAAADSPAPLARLLKSSKDLENIIESQRSEKVKKGVGYNAVPTPAADLYLSPKKDLSWTGLPEFVDDTDVASPNPPKPFVKFVKPKDSQPESKSKEQETPKKSQVKPNVGHMRPPLRSFGPRPHGESMRPLFRPAGHRPHGPLMNPRRPTMNGARPYKSFFQVPSYETRPLLKSSEVKNPYRALWVPTVNRYDLSVNRKFSTGRRNFPTANRKFPTASRKL